MPDPLVHVTVAVLAVWLFYDKKYRRYAFFLFPIAVLPDVDHFIFVAHVTRILFHNLFIILPVLGVALYARLKAKNVALYNIALIASFFLLSHIVLDFFTVGGVALFYPLITTKYAFSDQLLLTHGSLALVPEQYAPFRLSGVLSMMPAMPAFQQSELWGIMVTGLILPVSLFITKRLPLGERFCATTKA